MIEVFYSRTLGLLTFNFMTMTKLTKRDLCKFDPSFNTSTKRYLHPSFEWCSYNWQSCMEGGRLIHPDFPYQWYDSDQIRIGSDQEIYLTISYKTRTIHHWDGKIYTPVLACGTMRSVEEFGFGIFSCDVKCPHGYNLWPSFWTSGVHNWPPELDIMEAWSYEDRYFRWFIPQFPYLSPGWKTTTNVHYRDNGLEHENIGSRNISIFKSCTNPADEFVNYKVEWLQDSIRFYIGGKLVREVGSKISRMLTENLINPDGGNKMNVIFNVWAEDPRDYDVHINTPMVIKNFKYEPR